VNADESKCEQATELEGVQGNLVSHDSLWPVDLRFGPADDRDHLQRRCKALPQVGIGALTLGTARQRPASV
jgi:hypothetical protein